MQRIIFMDGFDSVRDYKSQSEEIFSTKLPDELVGLIGRTTIPNEVIDNVVTIFNSEGFEAVDDYLLDEGAVTQDEREIIVEALYHWNNKMRDTLEAQIISDGIQGDTTVLAGLLQMLDDKTIYNALSDEAQTIFEDPTEGAVYYQPILSDEEWNEHRWFNSFNVYRSYWNAKKAFPNNEIGAYSGDDIEDPTYMD